MTEDINLNMNHADEFLQSAMDAMKEEDFKKASEFFNKARVLFEEFEMNKKLATTCHMLGVCAQMEKDYEKAEEWFEKTVDIKGKIGSPQFMIDTVAQVGNLRYEQGMFEKALIHFGNAYLLALQYNVPIFMRLLADISEVSRKLGDEEFLKIWKREFKDVTPPMEKMELIKQPGKLIEALMSGRMTKEEFIEKWSKVFPGMEPPV